MLKSECTPEQWEARLASMRARRENDPEAVRAYHREYSARPEAKAKRQAKNRTEEKKAAERERYRARKEAGKIKVGRTEEEKRERRRKWDEAYNTPENRAARAERQRLREESEPARRAARLEYLRSHARKRNTNFTDEDYARAMETQGGKCAICGSTKRLHCDHDHNTGEPRGILCFACNATEGRIAASGMSVEEFCARLSEYLSKPTLKLID